MKQHSIFKFSNSHILKFSFCLLLSFQCLAQADDESRLSVSVAGGKSISLRTIYQQVSDDNRGELAGDGWAAQVGVTYRFMKHIGITARVGYNQNHTREEGVAKIALYQYNITTPDITQNTDWTGISALAGPSFHAFAGRFVFEARALAGYAAVTGPQFELSGVFSGRKINVKTVTGNSQNLAFGGGGTVRFKLSDVVSISVNGDFIQSNSVFNNISSVVTSGSITANPTSSLDQKVGFLNVMGGLQFNF
jgi:Outer membrane protein beta-barrel domain